MASAAIGAGIGLVGGLMQSSAAKSAANTQAAAQERAAQIAAESTRFRPVGITTGYGSSFFNRDAQGNVTGAGYTLNPQMQYIQNRLMGGILGGGYVPPAVQQPQAPSYQQIRSELLPQFTTTQQQYSGPAIDLGSVGLSTALGGSMPQQSTTSVDEAALEAAINQRMQQYGTPTGFGGEGFATIIDVPISGGSGYSLKGGAPMVGGSMSETNQPSGMGYLDQALNAINTTAPLGQGAASLMGLGQGYLATSPQEQAAKYMAEQQALLEPSRAQSLAALQNKLVQQGRSGVAVGGDAGMLPTNPEMAAYYNSLTQQNRQLAADATQGGMQYAQFGAGLLGTGGDMLRQMYGVQSDAFSPFQTAMGAHQGIEALGQQALDIGINVGAQGKGNVGAAQMLQQGMTQAAATRAAADSQSPWAGLLAGARQGLQPYGQQLGSQIGSQLQGWYGTSPTSGLSNQVSSLGSSTWNPWSDYNTGSGGWGNYGE